MRPAFILRKKSLISNYGAYSTPDIFTLCRPAAIFDITPDELAECDFEDEK